MKGIKHILSLFSGWLLMLLSRLPMPILYLKATALRIIVYTIFGYRKKIVRSQLKKSFPDNTDAQLLETEKRYYTFLTDLITETVKGFTAGRRFLTGRIRYQNLEILDRLYSSGKSGIVMMGHCGNWEWICRSAPLFLKNKVVVVYKPLSNRVFDRIMEKARTAFGVTQVPMDRIGRYMATVKEPVLLILVADQSPSATDNAYWTDFFGRKTAFLPGMEKLARRFQLPVFFCDVKKEKRGYYVCSVSELSDTESIIQSAEGEPTARYAQLLEKEIRKQPETWLWSHRRWKHSKD